MTQKLIMCRGLPWSGKSTWAKEYVKSNSKACRFNNDEFRLMVGRPFSKDIEWMLINQRLEFINNYLREWYTVVLDNTNLNPNLYNEYYQIATDYWVDFEIREFPVDVETCIERDKLRDNPVWEKVIRSMSKKWGYTPKKPTEFKEVKQNTSLTKAIIIDIDWTIAKMEWRNPYDFSLVHTDTLHRDVVDLVNAFLSKNPEVELLIVSWRWEECRKETTQWLHSNYINPNKLYMRWLNDKRKDSQVKYEILLEIIKEFNILWVMDDRNQVVQMWREAWLRCFQVADGNF